ncbi:hypothetical protein M8C21_016773 [Ambrosia artemisiifolia]|uniref:DUF4005 domain-containing protein n=1 Tax=Ambrosia artemisiifolia TaxID=4212 RepID=A0AAD5D325_AMBAR|nr:hypothetical protein M8C21_016773 [Ambrosia artemisiifolia]
MGKKSSWLSALKKALNHSKSNDNKYKKSSKKSSKKYWFGKQKSVDKHLLQKETIVEDHAPLSISPHREVTITEAENEQSKHAYSVAYATAMGAEAAVAAAHAAAEVVRLTSSAQLSIEEMAAIRIQTVYRGHLARRASRALRGLARLRSVIQGQSVKRQATSTLKCMQALARVQSQVRSRRVRMSEENKVVQQLLLKHEKELNNIRSSLGDTWDDSRRSKDEIEDSLRRKQEAAVRRERALAYAHTNQQMWKNTAKSANPTFLDSNNPHWGWSWLERWMAARPWENESIPDKEPSVGEIGKPVTRARSSSSRVRPESQMGSADGDSRSFYSVQQSDRNRWHSVTSSACDDKSVESSPIVPNYMASTESAKARSRMASPIHSPSPLGSGRKGGSDKGSVTGSAKKQLVFSGSPARASTRLTSH